MLSVGLVLVINKGLFIFFPLLVQLTFETPAKYHQKSILVITFPWSFITVRIDEKILRAVPQSVMTKYVVKTDLT